MKQNDKTKMTFSNFCFKSIIWAMIGFIMLPSIPMEPIGDFVQTVKADGGGYAANKLAEANINYNVDEDRDVNIEVNTELKVNANHRSLAFLDAAKIVNVNNTQRSDYKPEGLKEKIHDILPEYDFADLTEYSGFENEEREYVFVDDEKVTVPDYKYKLEYLINKNIINRTTDYVYDSTGVYMGMDRIIHPSVDDDAGEIDIDALESNGVSKPRYWDPSKRISKTDFLVELLKTGKVQESRPIAVQTTYSRIDEGLRRTQVKQEPIELSPYQSKMGELGIDSVNNDIVVKHDVFKQLNLITTNDVTEMYLMDALNRGIISKDEIGGTEGISFISSLPSGTFAPPGSWNEKEVLRQFYDVDLGTNDNGDGASKSGDGSETGTSTKLNGKQLATDDEGKLLDSYPKNIQSYQEIVSDAIDQAEVTDGLEYPWGNSFYYSVDACNLGNPASSEPTEIMKRFSCVDVDQGMIDTLRSAITGETDKGYRYFDNEDITLADAYVLTANFMKANGEEPHINQLEIDYISSTYGLDFNGLMKDEVDAIQYLIAKGILDPAIENISSCVATQLTNEIAVDLLYRVANDNYRCSFVPNLSEEEKQMLSRGYSQTSINVSNDPLGPSAEPLAINYKTGRSDTFNTTTQASLLSDRIKHPANYDYIYIRMPNNLFSDAGKPQAVVNLVVNNSFRTIIDPYNDRLNGGLAEYKIPERRAVDENGDYIYVKNGVGEPYYEYDEEGNKIPELDNEGNPLLNSKGEQVYKAQFELKWKSNILTDKGEDMHNLNYVYKDFNRDGYWVRYIVPKDVSSNLRMLVNWSNGTVEEYNGFSGEGVYYIAKEGDKTYSKISLADAKMSEITNVKPEEATKETDGHTLYNQVILIDTATRRYLGNSGATINALADINAEVPKDEEHYINKTNFKSYKDGFTIDTQVVYLEECFDKITETNKSLSGGYQLQGKAYLGPLDEAGLKNLLLADVNLIKFESTEQDGQTVSNPSINIDNFNNKLSYREYVSRMTLEQATDISNNKRWYIVYTPFGASIETELSYIYKEFNTKLSAEYNSKIPGYAKYNSSGDEIAMISREEIESWSSDANSGLNVVVLSDKVLYNANTGQRAFINTDEHFTLIGNNITRYPEDTMMCNKYGEKTFYNLDVIMELFADVDAVADKAGSSIFVSTNKANCMSEDAKYRLAAIRDPNTDQEPVYVDKTYMLEDSGNIFVCLSALSDRASNMIYFKDTMHPGLEFLIVYYPKTTTDSFKHAATVNNGLIASMQNNSTINSVSVNKIFEQQTAVLSAYLFSGGGGKNLKEKYKSGTVATASAGVLPSGYQYDIYLLGTDENDKPSVVSWGDFVNIFQDVSYGGITGTDVLKNAMMDDEIRALYSEGLEENADNNEQTNIAIRYLPTQARANEGTTSGTDKYVFRDLASHNLYFRLVNSDKTTNQFVYARYFKNRLYAQGVDDDNGKTTTASKLVNGSGTILTSNSGFEMSFDEPTILFNRQKYYYKTPEGMVPLEIYANETTSLGNLSNSSSNRDSVMWKLLNQGKIIINSNPDFRVQVLHNKNGVDNSTGGNIAEPFQTLQSTKTSDIGMFTPLRSQKVQILSGTGARQNRLFDYLAEVINSKGEGDYVPTTLLDYFDREMSAVFQTEYAKESSAANAAVVGSYADESGIEFFAPKAVREEVLYGTNSIQSSINPEFNGSIASMYENTWDFLDFASEKEFVKSVNDSNGVVQTEQEMDATGFFSNKFKSFTTSANKSLDKDGHYLNQDARDNDYFFTFTIGIPERTVSGILDSTKMKRINDVVTLSSRENDGSKYITADDPYVFFTLCRRNLNDIEKTKAIATAGIPLNALYFKTGSVEGIHIGGFDSLAESNPNVTGEDVLEYLFDKAWAGTNKDNIYLTSDADQSFMYNEIVSKYAQNAGSISYRDIKSNYCGNEIVPVYYQPTFAVPAGTTVVTGEGHLRTFASDRIRSEINYLSDMNNSIMAKYILTNSDYTDVTFLCEVPDYAEIVFEGNVGEAGTVLYKVGGNNARSSKGLIKSDKLEWIPTMLYKKSNSSGSNNQCLTQYSKVNDTTLAYQLYTSIFNIEVPTVSSQSLSGAESKTDVSNGSKIKLGSTLGGGLWRLPYGEELTGLVQQLKKVSETQSTTSAAFLDGMKGTIFRTNSGEYPAWCYSTDMTKDLQEVNKNGDKESRSYVAEAMMYVYKSGKNQFVADSKSVNSDIRYKSAYLHPIFNLPPTLVVEKDKNDANRYTVKYYVNPEIFGMDTSNKYIAYLKTRDTPAEDIVAAMNQTRSSNFDGNMFKVKVFIEWLESFMKKVWLFIQYVIPLILLILWLITTCLYGAVHYLAITHYYLDVLYDRLGFDIVAFLTCGVLGTNKVTRLSHYVIYSCIIFTLMSLIYMSLLQTTLLSAWEVMLHGI